ncbi:hypothetical protein A6F68_02262 [Tsuneonella dongtanensis]|uniref:Uncharacterized protein n=1 Tax=Tsuneonella dongtanensis TaxID=692370 RepID=A0A1B2AF30_9SPHN|nr:hypothetical protein A6F68_02262 [Tsuneonella dongtanensis]
MAKANRPMRAFAPGRSDVSASMRVRNGCAVRPERPREPLDGGVGDCGEGRLIACVNLVVEPEKTREKESRTAPASDSATLRSRGFLGSWPGCRGC